MKDVLASISELKETYRLAKIDLTKIAVQGNRYKTVTEIILALDSKYNEIRAASDFLDGTYQKDYLRFFDSYCKEQIEEAKR